MSEYISDDHVVAGRRHSSTEIRKDLFRDDQVGWTSKIITKLKGLKQKSWDYTWIHRENSGYLNDMYDWLSVGSFILSFLNAGILMFRTNLIYIQIFTVVLSFGVGLLQFFIKFKNYPELIEKHKMASSRFSTIHNHVERQLSLPVSMRQNPLHFHQWINQQFDTLFATAPDIDGYVIDRYRENLAKMENGKHRLGYVMEADNFEMNNDSSPSPSEDARIGELNNLDMDSATYSYSFDQSDDSIISGTESQTVENKDDLAIEDQGSILNGPENDKDELEDEHEDKDELEEEDLDLDDKVHKSTVKFGDTIDLTRSNSSDRDQSKPEMALSRRSGRTSGRTMRSRKSRRNRARKPNKFLNYEMKRFDTNLYQNSLYNLNNKCLMDDVVSGGKY